MAEIYDQWEDILMQRGLQKGREEGEERGIQIGEQRGIQIGMQNALRDIVLNLSINFGLSSEKIAENLKMPLSKIKELLSEK